MPEYYKERIRQMRPQFEAMALKQYGLVIKQGTTGIDSRPALIGAKYAEEQGKGDAYHKAVFVAYWQNEQDISNLDVLGGIAEAVGLNRDAFLQALTSKDYEALVDTDILLAQQIELSGVPALLFQEKYLIPGAQPYPELVKAVEYIKQRENLA